MDFGFVNSILRSQYFPPADMWFAGKTINYYYYGHYVAAFLTKLTGIDSAITYNLMIATLFAFTFSLTFSLTANLVYLFLKQKFENLKTLPAGRQVGNLLEIRNLKLVIVSGLTSALLISLGANLHPAYYNFKMGILKKPYCDGSLSYWYPNATRYIGYCPEVDDKTIHEFPSYSFIVSDLHGHVSDIPFVLLFFALCLNLFLVLKENKPKTFNFELLTFNLLPTSLVLAAMYMTNQWDFPIYLMVLGLVLLVSFYPQWKNSFKKLVQPCLYGGIILLLALPLIFPFQFNFEPIVKGIALVNAHSRPHQLLILWGAPWFFGLTFLIFLIKEFLAAWRQSKKTLNTFSPLISHFSSSDLFVLILFLVATILIIIPEIIYVKDIYISSYHRANTVFKLTYQSFIMFSIGIGYIIVRVSSSLKKVFFRKLLFAFYFLLFTLLMVYPFYSIKGYYGEIKRKNYRTLSGLQFLKRLYPNDYQAILWLNQNIKGQPVVLEAVGDSYTDYERISMATGLPTIEGWLVHEWLWRGSYDEPGRRSAEVQTIYESSDAAGTEALLQKYQVKYVVVGTLERQKYPQLKEEKFARLGKKVFASGKTAIFELP